MSEARLTEPHDPKIQQYVAATARGQAHWAGTGPDGTYCTTCKWARFHGYYAKKNKGGALKPIQCGKYASMMEDAPRFDAMHRSCRFYEVGDGPPPKDK